MFSQVTDFRDESDTLYRLLEPLSEKDFERETQFKNWTINEVLGHLHMWNWAADVALRDESAFLKFRDRVLQAIGSGRPVTEFEREWRGGSRGRELLEEWRGFYPAMAERFGAADPKGRVTWMGPQMSVRSSITARLMETWAHGQEVYDLLGVERVDTDRIRNIAELGVRTFGWTFSNRGLDTPRRIPYVRLTAPSGEIWAWNDPDQADRVEGSASEFCQVVTQVRNTGDTKLVVVGGFAMQWMSIAQCFAGPPVDPPPPGTRFRST